MSLAIATHGMLGSGGVSIVTVYTPSPPVVINQSPTLVELSSASPTITPGFTQTNGIWQGDVIVRTGIMQGLRELRKNPELLDYCFASLPRDELTALEYGKATVDKAREWFKNTDIAVRMNIAINSPKLPCISIEQQQASEAEATLGDVHYTPYETDDSDWPNATAAFSATSYDIDTGRVGIPTAITNSTLIFPGMVIQDRKGNELTILGTYDESTVVIDPIPDIDLSVCVLKYARPANIRSLESLEFKGTFAIGCHVQGEPEQLIWLSSILQFILLRYKEQYFEARGFERSTLSVTGMVRDPNWEVENVYTQYTQMSGFYRNYWPKRFGLRAQGVIIQPLEILGGTETPGNPDLSQEAWIMEDDTLDGIATGIKGNNSDS